MTIVGFLNRVVTVLRTDLKDLLVKGTKIEEIPYSLSTSSPNPDFLQPLINHLHRLTMNSFCFLQTNTF